MKHFTWIGAVAVGVIIAAIYWTNRQSDLAVTPLAEPNWTTAAPVFVPPPSPKMIAWIEMIEPILVLPEWEIAPAPESVESVFEHFIIRAGEMGGLRFSAAGAVTPRPEVGHISRPWMPYAAEDRELSDTRRLEWTKIAVRESAPADLEETAEPPLLEKKAP